MAWRTQMARSLPFYYGWVIVANTVSVSLSTRTVMAVAMLSVFVVPMTKELDWSRGLFSGAVSLGGLCAVVTSPFVGRWLDRFGAGFLLAASSALTGVLAIGLSAMSSPLAFYALYVPGRMIFAGPLELGLPTSISNWFIRRRPLGLAIDSVAKGAGLAILPLAAQFIITGWDWRTAWFVLGIAVLIVGVVPSVLVMARRPEDMGLEADPAPAESEAVAGAEDRDSPPQQAPASVEETNFTVRQAMATRAFWILTFFSAGGFMVQAGISLHQAPHYINQGLPGPLAALMVSTFAFAQMLSGPVWSAVGRRMEVRFLLAAAGFIVAIGALSTAASSTLITGILAASAVGFGVGGLHLLLRLAWADYYGREHLGAIRGITLSAQVGGQALGPIIAGVTFDWTGGYQLPFLLFTGVASLSGLLVLAAAPPKRPAPVLQQS
jgi:sugar phosphate permease